jgi:hypothetical protein
MIVHLVVAFLLTGRVGSAAVQSGAGKELPNTALDTLRGRAIYAAARRRADYAGNEACAFNTRSPKGLRLRDPSDISGMVARRFAPLAVTCAADSARQSNGRFRSTDRVGNVEATNGALVRIAKGVPGVSITVPTTAPTWSTSSSSVALGGTVFDIAAVTSVTWSNAATGGKGTASGTASWSASVPLKPGSNVITVTAKDAANNSGTATLTVSYTPITGAIRTWIPEPFPQNYPARGKHARLIYDSRRQRLVLTGGDRGTGGDGNFSTDVEALTADGVWRTLRPFCGPAGALQPARPDNVVWVYDSRRDRAIIMPGFFGGVIKALAECPDPKPNPVQGTALIFDFATNTWSLPPWPAPPKRYGGDDSSTFGVYDPVSDQVIRYRYDGSGTLEMLSLTTNTWQVVRLGSVLPSRTTDQAALAQSYAYRSQLAIDVTGRAVYWVAPFKRQLQRFRLDQPAGYTGEVVAAMPADWRSSIDSSQEIYMVFDPVHRVLLMPSVPWLVGEVTGLAIYHVDSGVTEWESVPLNLVDRIRGTVWGFDEASGCLRAFGGLSALHSQIDGSPLAKPIVSWRYCYGTP